jgi:hypothetical protein
MAVGTTMQIGRGQSLNVGDARDLPHKLKIDSLAIRE